MYDKKQEQERYTALQMQAKAEIDAYQSAGECEYTIPPITELFEFFAQFDMVRGITLKFRNGTYEIRKIQ